MPLLLCKKSDNNKDLSYLLSNIQPVPQPPSSKKQNKQKKSLRQTSTNFMLYRNELRKWLPREKQYKDTVKHGVQIHQAWKEVE